METQERIKLKLECFKLALSNKPDRTYNPMGQMNASSYSVDQLIKDAEKIYDSLIK